MRRSWPFVLAVIAIGALAGVAIAGRPQSSDGFVLDSTVTVAGSPSSTSAVPDTAAAATTAAPTPTTSTAAPTTSSEAAATTVAPTTVPTTAAATTIATPTTATTVPGPLPRNQVRLVLANGDGRFRLASTTADRIRPLGYVIDLGDATTPVDATVIYYRPGFDDEAAFAAVDIGVPDAIIFPFPINRSQPITNSDDNGDVIIVLGPDAPR